MRKLVILCAALLCVAALATAQDQPGSAASPASAESAAAPAAAPHPSALSSGMARWQVAVSYEYFRLRAAGATTNLNGFNTSVTYFANDWFGIEADGAGVFGSLTPTFKEKLAFYGGGPHLAFRHSAKYQPWVHALFGGGHLSTTQTVGPSSFNGVAIITGGGFDVMMSPRLGWRAQADYAGTRFAGVWQKNFQIKAGIVLNF